MKTKLSKSIPKKRRYATVDATTAREAIGELIPGTEVFAITKGDYSLIDIIDYAITASDSNRAVLCTWTAANGSLQTFADMIRVGRLKDVKIICDPSFVTRKPEIAELMHSLFGADSIRCAPLHAKFVVLTGGRFPVTLRTSMNLNPNRRIESFELSTCPKMAEFHLRLTEDIWRVFGVPKPGVYQSMEKSSLSPLANAAPKTKIGLF